MTFRSSNRIIELEGENYVRGIVESHNCIFQKIDGGNDQGNDVYVELVENNRALNFGFFAQIKSGNSYRDNAGYKIPSDHDHLRYWNEALYPMLGIVYDPEKKKAFWLDIKEYVARNTAVLQQASHNIRLSSSQEFSSATFPAIRDELVREIQQFKSLNNFGRSLELFASVGQPDVCYEGFKSLYSSHRDKEATWFYILSAFSKIQEEGIRRNILGVLSNYLDNPFVLWHQGNMHYLPTSEERKKLKSLMNLTFGREEILLALPYLREGVTAGSFPHLVYQLIDQVEDLHSILKEIAFGTDISRDDRNHIFWLYLHTAKHRSIDDTLQTAEAYLHQFPYGYDDEALIGVRDSIACGDLMPIGIF